MKDYKKRKNDCSTCKFLKVIFEEYGFFGLFIAAPLLVIAFFVFLYRLTRKMLGLR